MKNLTTSALIVLLALTASFSASARIRRVNNTGVAAITNVLYVDFASALAAASNGDTLQMEPSGTSYGSGLNCTKRLVILGPGYFLGSSQNAGLQANPAAATMGDISFTAGSENSVMAGITVPTIYLQTDNITIQRCYVSNYIYFYNYSHSTNNCNVRQNYVGNIGNYYNNYTSNNCLITNNIIFGSIGFPAPYNGEFTNNVVLSSASLDNFNVRNNYFAGSFTPNSNVYSYNATAQSLASQPTFTASNNSLTNVSQASVFVLAPTGPGQFDAWYQLKTGTNALRGAGQNGVDIGAFGGSAPYKLGGLPAIPAIYQYSQYINGNTLNVNVSTRSNN